MKLRWKRWAAGFGALAVAGGIWLAASDYEVRRDGAARKVSAENAPGADAIIVLGAKVHPDGRLSEMLKDRMITAAELYESGKADKILVSGDHGTLGYNEVRAMKDFLLERGIAEEHIFMDHAGFNTYESMYRAKAIFQIRKAVVVSQDYHLARALYDAEGLGIEAYGVAADRQEYRGMTKFKAREMAARSKDFALIRFFKPQPTYLGDVIPITGDGRATEDSWLTEDTVWRPNA
ncbi:vancomycin high temperature exclusion protein [Paenibacillus sp. UNC499MF]|uniref:SanA/YdcF family protein n=1 Tax=Paenibacillus sp. UNC499MF TaxID=1502751 RepID=UPI00089F90C0|nr:ElyC/SanA/YdcF family protein [Paenibacillus sp. UNC499MF]SEG03731.1 protein SanA, affects membrane permeability for vancomycin [Paenibacillus sp. UNC499MF]